MSSADHPADIAVAHIIRQMQADGRLAYLIGPGSRSYELLTAAHAARWGLDLKKFRSEFAGNLHPQRIVTKEDDA